MSNIFLEYPISQHIYMTKIGCWLNTQYRDIVRTQSIPLIMLFFILYLVLIGLKNGATLHRPLSRFFASYSLAIRPCSTRSVWVQTPTIATCLTFLLLQQVRSLIKGQQAVL